MLHFDRLPDKNILVVAPDGPLDGADFENFAAEMDGPAQGKVARLMIKTKSFPGWKNVQAFASHLRFVLNRHRQIERIAVVSDSRLLRFLPSIARYLVHPSIRHFYFAEEDRALGWLETGRP